MNVVIFGATGMVGRGVLLECLDDPDVKLILSVVRRSTGAMHPKLEEIVHDEFSDYRAAEHRFHDLDACFFCLGVSSAGMSEDDYRRVTYDYTLAAARALKARNPGLTFCYVSGAGTDSTEKGRTMWARVKGKTENDLLAMFEHAFMFRPGYIEPRKGVVSSTRSYRVLYKLSSPLVPVLRRLAPNAVTTSDTLGRAMIAAVRRPPHKRVLDVADINALGRAG